MSTFPTHQLKLTTGEELICEVMDWENEDNNIIIRNAMVIETTIFENNERVYMFKPWFLYLEKPTDYIILDSKSIVASAQPNDLLAIQYISAVSDMKDLSEDRIKEHNKREAIKLKSILENLIESKKEPKEKKSKPKSNIINFVPPDTTFH
jgi:hypothetical protein